MRVMILAAGRGSRLRPLTDKVPKCLVKIKGQPLLDIWLERLTKCGFGPFLINTHYLADQVLHFAETSPYRKTIKLVNEPNLLGTAGTLIANLDFFNGEDGMLIHADNYCLADFLDFKEAHINRPPVCLMTMMTFRTSEPQSCGIVQLDENNIVVGFHEKIKSPPGNLANGAIYMLSSKFLKEAEKYPNTLTDFSTEIINRFIGKIYSYETSEMLLDIGTIESYNKANEDN